MSRPSFSIVVPTYQRRELVCDAVRSLCAIDYAGAVELIVVVDGSTDGSEAALRQIDCPFPVKIIVQQNEGLAAARNRGAAESANEVVLFLDDDMICISDILVQHARTYADGADAVLGHIPLDPGSSPGFLADGVGAWAEERAKRLSSGASPTLFDLVGGHLSLRRAVFEQAGGFDRRFTHAGSYGDEDLDLGTRLTDSFDVRFNPEAISFQRYVVTPTQNIEQWYQAGRADVAFARKHPRRARELFDLHGAASRRTRFLLRPVSKLPLLPHLLSSFAAWLASREQGLPRVLQRFAVLLFYAARDVRYWAGVHDAGGVPAASCGLILCYHAIADLSGDPVLGEYGIPPERFARQLDSLHARGFTFVSPDELIAMLEGEAGLPRKALLLTFDDCYEELPDIACTLLQPRGIAGLAFAVSGAVSGTNEWDQAIGARKLRLLDPDGLERLRRHGVEIGCHTRTHRPLPSLADRMLVEETRNSADDLAALGLPRPRFFAFPHGVQDERSRAAVRDAGFAAGFGLSSRRVSRANDRFALPRIEILASDGPVRFWLKTRWPRLSLLLVYGAGIPGRAARKLSRVLHLARAADQPAE